MSWKKSRNILQPKIVQSHHQIKPNAVKLLLSTGLFLAWSQFSVLTRALCQPKYELNISMAKNQ